MGRRHHALRFMPGMLVFPGGRVDRADYRAPCTLDEATRRQMEASATPSLARALAVCAARELEEETALVLRDLGAMHYLTRAITPADRPIRFHARFLVAEAHHATGDIQGSGELEELRFFALVELSTQPLARITQMIIEDFCAWLAMPEAARATRPLTRIIGRDLRLPERRSHQAP